MNAIEFSHVSKSYSDFALTDLSLELPEGTILGLIGENGAGKTTTIRLLMHALRADSGSIRVLGTDNQDKAFTGLKNEIGVVLDEAYFPEVLTAENVNHVMAGTYSAWDAELYVDYLARFSLPEHKPFKNFSRGMKMKLSIAAALSHHPRLLVLDEATGGLDPMMREEILDILNEFTREENHSILISSHIVSDLEKICDYVAFLHRGRLLFCEEKDALLDRYRLLKLTKEQLEAVPPEAIAGRRVNDYGAEVLVRKDAAADIFPSEHLTLEDIILFLGHNQGAA